MSIKLKNKINKKQARVAVIGLGYVGLPLANVAHQSFSLLTQYQLTDVWELGGQAVAVLGVIGGRPLRVEQARASADAARPALAFSL